jgi:hypothetical protein
MLFNVRRPLHLPRGIGSVSRRDGVLGRVFEARRTWSAGEAAVSGWKLKLLNAGALIALIFATPFSHAQPSQLLFDRNGNLLGQTATTTALPLILAHPQNRIVAPGDSASFSIVAADTRLLNYQWRLNGTNITSATNDAVLLPNVSTNNEGAYDVVLTNPSGSVTSAPAMLWMDSDADGLPDSWERLYFTNLNQSTTADVDGDGVSNLQEFLDVTNPTNSTSALFRLTVLRDGGSVEMLPNQSTYTNGQTVTLTANAFSNETFRAWLGDIVTRSNPVTLVMTNNKTVSARFTPVVFTWTNFSGGDWNRATNWTPNLVPGSNDNVVISGLTIAGGGAFTVTLDTPADCASFTLDTGLGRTPTLTGSGTLTVRESFLWRGGTMSGSGRTVLESGATLTLDTGTAFTTLILDTRTLELGGDTFWITAGNLALNNAVITNRAGATFHALHSGSFSRTGGSPRFDNAGTFRKSVNPGSTTISSFVSFNNYAAVEIQRGALRLAGGGSSIGTFDAFAGAVVEWTGDTSTLNAGAQLNGAGLYQLNGGNVNVDASVTVGNLDLINGSSTLGGTGSLSIAGVMNWTAGAMGGTGRTLIAPGAVLNAANPSQINLVNRTLENGGTVLWTNGTIALNGNFITNRPGALFHAQGAGLLGNLGGSPRFDNAGTFRKSVNPGIATVGSGVSFSNSGAVEIQSGTLLFNGGFTNHGVVNLAPGTTNRFVGGGSGTGTFSAFAGAVVEWTGGTFMLNPGAQLNGAGLYRLNAGNVTADANLTVENLDVLSGSSTLGGGGTVTVTSLMNWTAGAMGGTGRTIITPGAVLHAAIPSQVNLVSRTLENGGTVLWTNGTIALNNSVVTNRPGGLFHALGAGLLGNLGGSPRFDNAGTFRKSANTGTSTISSGLNFTNYATVDIRSGTLVANGTYASTSNALLRCALGGTTPGTNYGRLQVAGTVTLHGALGVELINGFVPALNDAFTVVTAGTRNGTFNNFLYPSNAVTMQLSNTANSVTLRVTEVLSAIPRPVLLPPELIGSNIQLTWTAVSNAIYRLEFNPDLANLTNWNPVFGDVTSTSNTASKLDALTSSNRWYRVRVLP